MEPFSSSRLFKRSLFTRMLIVAALFLISTFQCHAYLPGSSLRAMKWFKASAGSREVVQWPASQSSSKSRKFRSSLSLQTPNTIILDSLDDLKVGENSVLIGTHDGAFHCDEALAISMLKMVPQFESACIIRSRDPAILEKCNVLVDVGSVYDPTIHRYDHHQRSFTNTLDGFNTKLSSAGLIYKHFGRAIIKRLLDTGTEGNSPAERNVVVDICYNKLYRSFIEHIDAIDNGVTSTESGELRCHLSTSLSARVGQLNPRWNQPQNSTIQNMQFTKALALTSGEFLTHVDEILASWYPARSIVQKAMKERFSTVDKEGAPVVAADGKIILLDRFCSWKDHVYEMEQQGNLSPVLYVLYPDMSGSWRVQAVPEVWSSFQSRKPLPQSWCGLKDTELSKEVGIDGCKFVHTTGFIGGHDTHEGAIAMALKALSME